MDLVTLLRFLQIYSHNAHNLLSGKTFFQDHEFLGGLYSAYEEDYDSLVERLVGTDTSPDLIKVIAVVADEIQATGSPSSFEECFSFILEQEKELCKLIEQVYEGQSQGTVQLIGNIADKSEMRQFKLKQRL